MTDTKPKIFIVEDEGIKRDRYCNMVCRLGFEYAESSGINNPVPEILVYQPHIALIDTKLPGITGWDICKALRKSEYGRQMGIIGMSSDFYEKEWGEAGADAFLHKSKLLGSPGMKNLEDVVKAILEKYRK